MGKILICSWNHVLCSPCNEMDQIASHTVISSAPNGLPSGYLCCFNYSDTVKTVVKVGLNEIKAQEKLCNINYLRSRGKSNQLQREKSMPKSQH